jgi:hypothetical protein
MIARPRSVSYDFAVLRAVPHPHIGAFVPIGVVLHARTVDYLGMRSITDIDELRTQVPEVDAELLARYLRAVRAICDGDETAGPVALTPPSERFHWLTSPRSDVIQSSPIHEGVCDDPERVLDALFRTYVRRGA